MNPTSTKKAIETVLKIGASGIGTAAGYSKLVKNCTDVLYKNPQQFKSNVLFRRICNLAGVSEATKKHTKKANINYINPSSTNPDVTNSNTNRINQNNIMY